MYWCFTERARNKATEKIRDPPWIQTKDFLNTSPTLLPPTCTPGKGAEDKLHKQHCLEATSAEFQLILTLSELDPGFFSRGFISHSLRTLTTLTRSKLPIVRALWPANACSAWKLPTLPEIKPLQGESNIHLCPFFCKKGGKRPTRCTEIQYGCSYTETYSKFDW